MQETQQAAHWSWNWHCPNPSERENQISELGSLLSHLMFSVTQLTGAIFYGIACDVISPFKRGDMLAIQLFQETASPSERPQSIWLSFRTTNQTTNDLAVVGTIRGGDSGEADDYFARRSSLVRR